MKPPIDFKNFTEEKLSDLRRRAGELEQKKREIALELDEINRKIKAWATVYEEYQDDSGAKVSIVQGRFAGMKVGEALRLIRREQPGIDKDKAFQILLEGGFDFQGKRARPSMHFAWIALESEGKNKRN
ncbi:MAG: hypothetical protein ABSG90_02725 [Dehalococcoidia bacterium]|jgi:hypothetical protein